MNRIYPKNISLEDLILTLPQSHIQLIRKLDDNLPVDWNIYVQPFLNGDKPPVVLMHHSLGVVIFSIYEWFKGEIFLRIKSGTNLKGEKYKYHEYWVKSEVEKIKEKIRNPIDTAMRFKENLVGVYVPDIHEAITSNKELDVYVRSAILFSNLTQDEIKNTFGDELKENIVLGSDYLKGNADDALARQMELKTTYSMPNDWYSKMAFWIDPPYHEKESGLRIKFSDDQKKNIDPEPKKHTRIRGVAGSGKTMTLAMRAANIAAEGKKVLLLTYNITLINYINHHLLRVPVGYSREYIEVKHFHGLCRDIIRRYNASFPNDDIEESDSDEEIEKKNKVYFGKTIPLFVASLIDNEEKYKRLLKSAELFNRYDAILVDEGQDFENEWYEVLCKMLTTNDEFVLVSDPIQNIYLKDQEWVDKKWSGTKFNKRWREISDSYRLPNIVVEEANRYLKQFNISIPFERKMKSTMQNELFDPHLEWHEVKNSNDLADKIFHSINNLVHVRNQQLGDIVILVNSRKEANYLIKYLASKGINCSHTFEQSENNYARKIGFKYDTDKLKITTIHSFKGWELPNVLFITPHTKSKLELFYVALTRTQQNFIVFNQNMFFAEYGKKWITANN